MNTVFPLVAALAALAAGCGNEVVGANPTASSTGTSAGGGGAGGSKQAAGPGGGGTSTGGGGGTFTDCTAPDGLAICGGPANCGCDYCADQKLAKGAVSVCINDALAKYKFVADSCHLAPDGAICLDLVNTGDFLSAPFSFGVLYENAGFASKARYADLGLWTGKPIPAPGSCPTESGFTLCGPNCGGCPSNRVCTGRSPRHPHGVCVPSDAKFCPCEASFGCFSFVVEPETQKLADSYGYCLEANECKALAASLPGGGKCVMP